jgi:hypothetical protein
MKRTESNQSQGREVGVIEGHSFASSDLLGRFAENVACSGAKGFLLLDP